MRSVFDEHDRSALLERIDRVTPGMKPRWGKMNAEMMLGHLASALRMGLGELSTKPKVWPLRYFPIKQLIVYCLPFPKGVWIAPELLPTETGSLAQRKDEVQRLMCAFAERASATSWPEHPAFGTLTAQAWGVLTYRHFDHHMRQFGA